MLLAAAVAMSWEAVMKQFSQSSDVQRTVLAPAFALYLCAGGVFVIFGILVAQRDVLIRQHRCMQWFCEGFFLVLTIRYFIFSLDKFKPGKMVQEADLLHVTFVACTIPVFMAHVGVSRLNVVMLPCIVWFGVFISPFAYSNIMIVGRCVSTNKTIHSTT